MTRSSARALLVALALSMTVGAPRAVRAAPAKPQTLLEWIRTRPELAPGERRAWESAVKKRFGGAALKTEGEENGEITVARSILASAIFLGVKPDKAALGAFEGYRGALGYVPPPIAIHYQVLVFQERQPRGRPIDLAFNFPKFYNDEIAPDLVEYWESSLAAGKVPDFALDETKEALAETRVKMRPLLLDKLRLLSRLAREQAVARGTRKAEIEADMRAVEAELTRSFTGVARRPEVLDGRKRPYDRLRIQLEDMGQKPGAEDRLLDPDAPPPPKRPPTVPDPLAEPSAPPSPPPSVPPDAPPTAPPVRSPPPRPDPGLDAPMTEPKEPPRPPPPPQPRAGDPQPELDPLTPSALIELVERYAHHLSTIITPWLGTPYLWGGATPRVGTDCSGFTSSVYRDGFSIELPRTSRDQFLYGRSVSKAELQPGDLVFFDTMSAGKVTHVGVYSGKGQFVHASSTKGVVYAKLDGRPYMQMFKGARRVLAYPASQGR